MLATRNDTTNRINRTERTESWKKVYRKAGESENNRKREKRKVKKKKEVDYKQQVAAAWEDAAARAYLNKRFKTSNLPATW